MTTEAGQLLHQMEDSLSSRREIAMLRIRCLDPMRSSFAPLEGFEESPCLPMQTGEGLAALFVPMLSHAVTHFLEVTKRLLTGLRGDLINVDDGPESLSDFHRALRQMRRLLRIYHQWVLLDPVLAEELAHQGAHRALIQLIQYSFPLERIEQNDSIETIEDGIQDVQDLAGTIAGESRPTFPIVAIQPFSVPDLQRRLPLKFDFTSTAVVSPPPSQQSTARVPIQEDVTILIHQITARQSAQADVGFVLWPSAVVLSNLIVNKHCSQFDEMNEAPLTILELGAGCGLSGLVAARFCQQNRQETPTVVLTDFNTRVLENLRRNIDLNDLSNICSVAGLDFYEQSGSAKNHWKAMDGTLCDPVDMILAADVICQASDAIAVAKTMHDVLKPGGTAYIVCADAKHRFGVDRLVGECEQVGLLVSTKTIFCGQDVHTELSSTIQLSDEHEINLEKTTGYVHGMSLTLFTVFKPLR